MSEDTDGSSEKPKGERASGPVDPQPPFSILHPCRAPSCLHPSTSRLEDPCLSPSRGFGSLRSRPQRPPCCLPGPELPHHMSHSVVPTMPLVASLETLQGWDLTLPTCEPSQCRAEGEALVQAVYGGVSGMASLSLTSSPHPAGAGPGVFPDVCWHSLLSLPRVLVLFCPAHLILCLQRPCLGQASLPAGRSRGRLRLQPVSDTCSIPKCLLQE